jgi:hypothetical protein
MVRAKNADHTPLTESQALALASWWSGVYLLLKPQQEGGASLHGVKIPIALTDDTAVIYCCEDAKRMENRRNTVNPGAPDWVG